MTLQEFSLEFDILYNNVTSNSAPPLDEYEKSVFLTMAQLEIVKELYSGRNQLGLAVETNAEARQCLSTLIQESEGLPLSASSDFHEGYTKYTISDVDTSSYIAILRDWIEVTENGITKEIPLYVATQDTIYNLLKNPFKGISKRRALKTETSNAVHIYFKNINENNCFYKFTYLSKPTPIILENIETDEELTIDGIDVTNPTPCALPDVLHLDILQRAAQLAKQTYVGQTQE